MSKTSSRQASFQIAATALVNEAAAAEAELVAAWAAAEAAAVTLSEASDHESAIDAVQNLGAALAAVEQNTSRRLSTLRASFWMASRNQLALQGEGDDLTS